VEVEFRKNKNGDLVAPRPKDLIGLLLAPAAADNHTPSNEYLNRYELRHAVVVVVAAYAMRAYIVVAVGPGKSRDVARQIASLPGVKMADA
jgi:glycerol dehydrogenase-like iron-containing ADH family enzyme